MKLWCIKDFDGRLLVWTLSVHDTHAQDSLLEEYSIKNWLHASRLGYKCIMVEIKEIQDKGI